MLRVQRYAWLFLPLLLSAFVLSFYSCGGGGGYESPPALSQSPLISPQTLNGWITEGYSDEFGYNKMVILHITKTPGNYNAVGHIPGAYLMDFNIDLHDERSDGIAKVGSMVTTRSKIEGFLRKVGVDQNTVIVLTGDDITHATRAYFTLVYWGLPRYRIKVLDGTIQTWKDAGYPLETVAPPEPAYSDFSFCQFQQNTKLRATLDEMIDVVEGRIPNAVIIDARSLNEYNGALNVLDVTKNKEAFQGHIKGAKNQEYLLLLKDKDKDKEGKKGFLSTEELKNTFNSLGIDRSKTIYIYCHTGRRATTQFFVLNAILGYNNVKVYDGSWLEWGQMSDEAKKGSLKANSPWRTDILSRSEVINYWVDVGKTPTPLTDANSYAIRSDMINQEDALSCGAGGEGGGEGGGFPPPGC